MAVQGKPDGGSSGVASFITGFVLMSIVLGGIVAIVNRGASASPVAPAEVATEAPTAEQPAATPIPPTAAPEQSVVDQPTVVTDVPVAEQPALATAEPPTPIPAAPTAVVEQPAIVEQPAVPTAVPAPVSEPTPIPQPISDCSCDGNAYNCDDFKTQEEAQACYSRCMDITGKDIHRLDGDQNGLACDGAK